MVRRSIEFTWYGHDDDGFTVSKDDQFVQAVARATPSNTRCMHEEAGMDRRRVVLPEIEQYYAGTLHKDIPEYKPIKIAHAIVTKGGHRPAAAPHTRRATGR